MKREKLIRSKDYIVSQIQLGLLNLVGNYKKKKKLKDYQLANELGVSKGYVSQLLNASFDHKISKVVDLALACNTVPLIYFVDIDAYVKHDAEDKIYELMPVVRPKGITYAESAQVVDLPPNSLTNTPLIDYKYSQEHISTALSH